MSDLENKYRIQSVAEMTGVPASTLRTWEQRYGFPTPDRTASSYRVYSQSDIDQIAQVRALCEDGMSAAEAVQAIVQGRVPAQGLPVATTATGSSLTSALVAAVEAFDPARLDRLARTVFLASAHRPAFQTAIAPAWQEVRRKSLTGTLGRHHERLATEVFGQVARDVLRHHQPSDGSWALLGCFADEDDVAPAFCAALALQEVGLRPLVLGPRTRASVIRHAAQELGATVVGLAVSDEVAGQRARDLVDDYASAIGDRTWFVIGDGAPALDALARAAGGRALPDPTGLRDLASSLR